VAFPAPIPGRVIRYSYLWKAEYDRGQEEGLKDRPCTVVLITTDESGEQIVTVLPITHTPPHAAQPAVELPQATKRRLRLDDARSWVMLNEANRFAWPGPDLRPLTPGDANSVVYGPLPYALFEDIRLKFIAALKAHAAVTVPRTQC